MDIVVVGAGKSGISFLDRIREKQQDVNIKLVDKQEILFDKSVFYEWLIDNCSDSDFVISQEEVKKDFSSLEIINDKAQRINFNKRKLFFKEISPIEFNKIVLCCGALPAKMEFGGRHKRGVFYVADCNPAELKESLQIYPNVVVYVETDWGLKLIEKLTHLNDKDIKVVTSLDSSRLDFLKDSGMDIYFNQEIIEAFGDSRVKAVKMSSGKFIACDTLILDRKTYSNTEILKDNNDFFQNGKLKVDEELKVNNLDFCFACGAMIREEKDFFFEIPRDAILQETEKIVSSLLY